MIAQHGSPNHIPGARQRAELADTARPLDKTKDIEILILRHSSPYSPTYPRPAVTWVDRGLLSALSRLLPAQLRRPRLVSPRTPLRWHAHLAARHWTHPPDNQDDHPPHTRALLLRMARENPTWGSQPIQGELSPHVHFPVSGPRWNLRGGPPQGRSHPDHRQVSGVTGVPQVIRISGSRLTAVLPGLGQFRDYRVAGCVATSWRPHRRRLPGPAGDGLRRRGGFAAGGRAVGGHRPLAVTP